MLKKVDKDWAKERKGGKGWGVIVLKPEHMVYDPIVMMKSVHGRHMRDNRVYVLALDKMDDTEYLECWHPKYVFGVVEQKTFGTLQAAIEYMNSAGK